MTTVLVVDDSRVDRRLVGGLLGKDPEINLRYAANGAEAVESLRQETPDLVITDLIMPELNGLELVAHVREHHPLVPVILMTSKGSEELAVQALQQGAASYVPKRAMGQKLCETVQRVLSVAYRERSHSRLMGAMIRSDFAFTLENDSSLFRPLVAYLQESIAHMGVTEDAERTRIGIAVEEALANALYHGNLAIGSELREVDSEAYYALVDERRHKPPFCDRRIQVEASFSRQQATFVIRDEGRGFDPTTLPDPTDPANLERVSGRGVLLMRTFMDDVAFSATGNQVKLTKLCRPKA